jgi:hypothetical protein
VTRGLGTSRGTLELLFPGTPDQPVEILPDETTSTPDASTWFIGTPDWLATLRDQLATLIGALTTRVSLSARDIRMGETQ